MEGRKIKKDPMRIGKAALGEREKTAGIA